MTALGFAGNVYVLGGQIKEIKVDVKDMNDNIEGLKERQNEMDRQDMSLAEKIFMDCGKKK